MPAFVIHHLLHPTNSLITHRERLIRDAPQLTINSKDGRSGLARLQGLVPAENVPLFSSYVIIMSMDKMMNILETNIQTDQSDCYYSTHSNV